MTIELHPPLLLSERGQRDINEDCIYPNLDSGQSGKVFLVCDGVGGAEKGEEASRIVCQEFAAVLESMEEIDISDVETALHNTEKKFNDYQRENPSTEGMASTLTLLTYSSRGMLVAHAGDSRVYQFRGHEILFRTTDHSYVQELVDNNIITEAQALNHPKRNVITRAVMGLSRPVKPEFKRLEDIKPGDFFLLCTDGIMESVSDSQLVEIIGNGTISDEEKVLRIQGMCREHSRDNYSMLLLKVKSVGDTLPSAIATSDDNHEVGTYTNLEKTGYLLFAAAMVLAGLVLITELGKPSFEVSNSGSQNDTVQGIEVVPVDISSDTLIKQEMKDTMYSSGNSGVEADSTLPGGQLPSFE